MIDRCIVCRGSKRINLPLFYPMEFSAEPMPMLDDRPMKREYPCPECTEQVSIERVYALKQESWRNNDIDDPGYQQAVRQDCAHQMINALIERGYIRFERARDTMGYGTLATLAVASPKTIATIEERTHQHQEVIARAAGKSAIAEINNWGSEYGCTTIEKSTAMESIHHAINGVVKQFKERWKADK